LGCLDKYVLADELNPKR